MGYQLRDADLNERLSIWSSLSKGLIVSKYGATREDYERGLRVNPPFPDNPNGDNYSVIIVRWDREANA